MTFEPSFEQFSAEVLPASVPVQLREQFRRLARPAIIDRKSCAELSDAADHFVFIAAGATKLVAQGTSGGEQILSFQFAGDFVSVPGLARHAYWLAALREAKLLVFNADDVLALAREHPAMLELLLARTLSALFRYREQLLTVGRRSATERVAGFLVTMSNVRQVTANGGRTLNLVMTRREIADCLGLTVETVSRQFSKLRDLRLIETPSRTIVTVIDREQLARYAGSVADTH